jgi:GNAT superfamily N-acetyltransferase
MTPSPRWAHDRHRRELARKKYDLGGFDRASLKVNEEIAARAGFVFRDLQAFVDASGPAASGPAVRLSFSRMLRSIVTATGVPLALSGGQFVVVAQLDNEPVGLSIIDPAGVIAFDALTWTDPRWRHRGLATAMKIRAIDDVQQAGAEALWAPGRPAAAAFYKALGLRVT